MPSRPARTETTLERLNRLEKEICEEEKTRIVKAAGFENILNERGLERGFEYLVKAGKLDEESHRLLNKLQCLKNDKFDLFGIPIK